MNLRQFDLNLLVALDALLAERNVTRAAERLFLSQSAMSGRLARLRHAFGDELLVQVGRNLEPTTFAMGIADRAHAFIREFEDPINATQAFCLLRSIPGPRRACYSRIRGFVPFGPAIRPSEIR